MGLGLGLLLACPKPALRQPALSLTLGNLP